MKIDNIKIDELAKKVKKGDKKAFEELYRLTSPMAYFVALQICNDEHEAEDILQESYITALNKISTLERTESFMSWFNKIVVNKTKDFLRKKNPKLLSQDDEWLLESKIDETETFSPDSNVDKDELRDVVMDAVKELSTEKRACVMMKYFNDMSVNEISDTMGIPVSTVKNRLFDARRELKKLFEKKGITAAYSVAPFGVIGWAYTAAFENFSQTFENSASAAKILTGIAAAGTAATIATAGTAATVTTAGTATASGGLVAKIISGVVVAGIVTGSTIGITNLVKNKNADNTPPVGTSYNETVDNTAESEPENEDVNIIKVTPESNEEYESVVISYNVPGTMSLKVEYKGELKEGKNHITYEDDSRQYFVMFNAEKSGYYNFDCNYSELENFCYVAVPDGFNGKTINSFANNMGDYRNGFVYYIEEGETTLVVEKSTQFNAHESEIDVQYLGEELNEVIIDNDDLNNIVLGYNESTPDREYALWQNQGQLGEGYYSNYFNTTLVFSDGKELDMGRIPLLYRVKDGELKVGKNDVVFTIFDEECERTITVQSATEYVKDIEISNLDEFLTAQIGEDGFTYSTPEEFEITVTYADGTKETFDNNWDGFLNFDNGVELRVMMMRSEKITIDNGDLRTREPLKFIVAIGDHRYIEENCTINEFDIIGYRKALTQNNVELANEYKKFLTDLYAQAQEYSETPEERIRYSFEYAENAIYYSLKLVRRIAGFELDYAITTYEILTNNEFDLF